MKIRGRLSWPIIRHYALWYALPVIGLIALVLLAGHALHYAIFVYGP